MRQAIINRRETFVVGLLVGVVWGGLLVEGCGGVKAPATLSAPAQVAWYGTRVIKALDLVRDTAIDAAAQRPPVLPETTARKIVLLHESLIKTIHDAPSGWVPSTTTAVMELQKSLAPADRAILDPYLSMVLDLLKGVPNG